MTENLISLPAYCRICGAIFPSGIFVGRGTRGNQFIGNIAVCPNGHPAGILDGTIDVVDNLLQVRESGPVSTEMLSRLEEIRRDYLEKKITAKSAIDAISELLPGSSTIIKKLGSSYPSLVLIIVFLLYLGNFTADIWKKLSSGDPAPSISIVNNVSVVNKLASNNDGSNAGGKISTLKRKARISPDVEVKRKKKARKKSREQRAHRKRSQKRKG